MVKIKKKNHRQKEKKKEKEEEFCIAQRRDQFIIEKRRKFLRRFSIRTRCSPIINHVVV